ncbi:conserved hypothetical protein [Deferribacter desulfuricans SSM1]|uniref:Spermatogenesis-associated protein 20-like TRX domain-containing protein n=1 Tax=Deferribacter desulfuricans (strain DSM 14783 / JCM 11476 / NBRC 101012 / SSM1) TaxID=639282 RepID=D3PE75_DEFDS|nr:DUF255 domain-containing protein [Deferribacter desulfuricans]BAI80898.1 conserved hypothetical protein [Deferribacter desulfuricans SSM1]
MEFLISLLILFQILHFGEIKINRLFLSNSSYLKQHQTNPVNWHFFNSYSLFLSKYTNKPLFISIGFKSCHWCNELEKELFKKSDAANFLNKKFIPVKIDKEEMPQIDNYFQSYYFKIYGKNAGWPLNIISDYKLKPKAFFSFVPYKDEFTGKSYKKIILEKLNEDITIKTKNHQTLQISKVFDQKYGGFLVDGLLKFPRNEIYQLLADRYIYEHNINDKEIATLSLYNMASKGLFDIIDGGFFRYSTDTEWIIPHFEKMLYTNALLISTYLRWYSITNNKFYLNTVKKTLSFWLNNMYNGKYFYSSINADSNDMEGQYYLIDYRKLQDYLKNNYPNIDIKTFEKLHITKDGNFDYFLNQPYLSDYELDNKTRYLINILQTYRLKKPFPQIDKQIIFSWNMEMLKALIDYSYFDRKILNFIIKTLFNLEKDFIYHNNIFHSKNLNTLNTNSLLEDYAFYIETLIALYNRTLNKDFFYKAIKFTNIAINKFYKNGNWYTTESHKFIASLNEKYKKSAALTMLLNLKYILPISNKDLFIKVYKETYENISKLRLDSINNPSFYRLRFPTIKITGNRKNLNLLIDNKLPLKYHLIFKETQDKYLYLTACYNKICFIHTKSPYELIKIINNKINNN